MLYLFCLEHVRIVNFVSFLFTCSNPVTELKHMVNQQNQEKATVKYV